LAPNHWLVGWAGAPSPTASPSAIEAARALAAKLSALASRVVAGINYRDYGVAVADIHEAWRRLGKQPGATAVPAYAALQAAMGEYDFAHDVWDYYFASGGRNDVLPASSPNPGLSILRSASSGWVPH